MVDIERLNFIREHLNNKAKLYREANGNQKLFKERLIFIKEIEMIDTLLIGLKQLGANADKIIEKYKHI